ncbi:MAG: putative porin [Spirochaetia bacterium]|nr:putative porin [Spirochaetia bacterium]
MCLFKKPLINFYMQLLLLFTYRTFNFRFNKINPARTASILLPVISFLISIQEIYPNPLDLSFEVGRNSGKYIEETGQKTANNLNGFSGGSRITYPRNFTYFGIGINWYLRKFELISKFRAVEGMKNTGTGRDEDFYLDQFSTAKGAKIAIHEGKFYDSAHTFTGTRNFADAKGTMSLKEYSVQPAVRYYFKSDPHLNGGFFLQAGYNYTFSFYRMDDIVQYLEPPIDQEKSIYYIPGKVLTLSVNSHEYLLGAGYRLQRKLWSLEFSFIPLLSYSESRDRHVLRFINFFIQTEGSGFLLSTKFSLYASDSLFFGIEYLSHRNYQYGTINSRGGVTPEDIISNFLGPGKIYMNLKEASVNLSVTKRFFQTSVKEN